MQEKVQRHFVDEVAYSRFLLLCNKLLQLSDLKQYTFIMLQFSWVRSTGNIYLGPLLRVSWGLNISVDGLHSFLELRVFFQTYLVFGRIHFLEIVVLRSLFSCWMSAGHLTTRDPQFLAIRSSHRPFLTPWKITSSKLTREFLAPDC